MPSELLSIAIGIAAAALIALAACLAARARVLRRVDELERASAARSDALQARLREQERLRHADHGALLQLLERRLGEAATAQAHTTARLGNALATRIEALKAEVSGQLGAGHGHTVRALGELQARFERRQGEALASLNDALNLGTRNLDARLGAALARSSAELGARVDALTRRTDAHLDAIGARVDKRLSDGFEKTTATFNDVLTRLALIDEAQKKITELSGNVVSLQEVLADKRSRGAFGEVQLNALVANVMPPSAYALQYTLGNGRRVDCMLFLPQPTGAIAIDSKFPLESFQRMTDLASDEAQRRAAERRFRTDVRAHIKDIAERYIVPGETSDGAIMFIPAEAVFAEIQAHQPEVVQEAHRARVWMASPTTLVAILNTARAVLKDDATRKQMHVIRRHLAELARDFDRFRERMDRLAAHMDQANRDVQQVHTSARKLSARFDVIEKVELEGESLPEGEALPQGAADARAGEATGSG